ncbi:hypothetical protein V496_02885 [Pseudogymnoascus sp. VKM F-4515 (FW-2607)]|nr:hypothetical protein V496_02885 [Pseudogymnoascus sp. VKM F-4515 (FW-2607)]
MDNSLPPLHQIHPRDSEAAMPLSRIDATSSQVQQRAMPDISPKSSTTQYHNYATHGQRDEESNLGSVTTIQTVDSTAGDASVVDESSQACTAISTRVPKALHPLPVKRQHPIVRNLRHTYWAVYQRLFSVVTILNAIAFVCIFTAVDTSKPELLSSLATAAATNILVAILMRQEYVINFIFKTCWMIPHRAPLRLRRMLAKVYEFGGMHSGAAFCSTAWFIAYSSILTKDMVNGAVRFPAMLAVAWVLVFLLILIIATAMPMFRMAHHNSFEVIHRIVGWTALALFWAELFLYAIAVQRIYTSDTPAYGLILIREPAFWLLAVTTACIIWPWLFLRKLAIKPEKFSDRAIRLHFTGYKVPPFCGIRLSKSPLLEWHAFACIANDNGGSVLISSGGDWTRDCIANPPPYYYVKGIPVTGVLNMAQAFRLSVIVTTGSGIGPCLSYLAGVGRQGTCRMIWSAPNPWANYGADICDAVTKVDPNAMIINTESSGRQDLASLTYQMYIDSGAEAVFVISNPRVTKKIVYAMESRGVPAFGPVWDS